MLISKIRPGPGTIHLMDHFKLCIADEKEQISEAQIIQKVTERENPTTLLLDFEGWKRYKVVKMSMDRQTVGRTSSKDDTLGLPTCSAGLVD